MSVAAGGAGVCVGSGACVGSGCGEQWCGW